MTEKDGDKIELSRSGLANAPATEYLPNYSSAGSGDEAADDWEEDEIKITKYWDFDFDCSGFAPPKEFTSIGKIPNKNILNQIADILYFYRQGKSQACELTIALSDWWMTGQYRPTFTLQVLEADRAVTFLATGLNFSCEPDANLILADLWWIGYSPTASKITAVTGSTWLQTPVQLTEATPLFSVGDRVEVRGVIPGIEAVSTQPTRVWVTGVQVVDGKQQIQVSSTQAGSPVVVTDEIVGQSSITAVRSLDPQLAFAQARPWLQTKPTDWLQLSLNDWLLLEVL